MTQSCLLYSLGSIQSGVLAIDTYPPHWNSFEHLCGCTECDAPSASLEAFGRQDGFSDRAPAFGSCARPVSLFNVHEEWIFFSLD